MIFRALKVNLLFDGKRQLRLPSTECSLGLHASASQNVARFSRRLLHRQCHPFILDYLNSEFLLREIALKTGFRIQQQLVPINVVAAVAP